MCQYCSLVERDAWSALLEYDTVYQEAIGGETESTYGFHESWDELREEVGYGV